MKERPEVAPTSPPDAKKIRELVARIPGAQVWQEGMKLPGQLEREEMEAHFCGLFISSGCRGLRQCAPLDDF